MAIRITFDAANNPEAPTIVLAQRSGDKLGQINAHDIAITDNFNDASEMSFKVYKELNGEKCALWDEITNFKLVYCVEWNAWFEITVELDEDVEIVKTVFATSLGWAELGQINLYNIEINTEDDIARDDYKAPTILFDETDPSISLLNRITEKAPHYKITHVDNSIAKIQRTFSFDNESIVDAFQDIAEEIKCIFILNAETDGDGKLQRTIEVYDLDNYCFDCKHRWESTEQSEVCPECGSENVRPGYGEDTTIFIAADDLAEDIGFETDTDAVKNCFKLEGGDDLMTATIRNCNPNGTDYLWYFSDDMKHEMPASLVYLIEQYDKLYEHYQNDQIIIEQESDYTELVDYNNLVDKYKVFNEDLQKIPTPMVGYPALMNAYYNTIDLELYLRSSMMPSVEHMETDAKKELAKLTRQNLSPVAVQKVDVLSNATADNVVLSMARITVDARFKVVIEKSSISNNDSNTCVWTGNFTVTNYYDEEDTATGSNVTIIINEDYEEFVKEKIEKQLARDKTEDVDIVGLFEKDYNDFVNELRKYSLNRLKSFQAACQAVLDILVEQGVADNNTWSTGDVNLYDNLYRPYLNKMNAIMAEAKLREKEIETITGTYDSYGDIMAYGLQTYLEEFRDEIQEALDFENYLGEENWLIFCSYRREDKYSNDNFISDALDNKQLFERAQEFLELATDEIHKSAEQQHSISSNLKNLLLIDKFKPIVDYFSVGNWLRIIVDDTLYKLRLLSYSIDYDDIDNIDVDFSDVVKAKDAASDIQSVLDQASSMATSYDSVKRQAADGKNTSNLVSGWVADGLDLTNMSIVGNAENQNIEWGETGLWAREYLPITDTYDDRQLKLINRGLYVTDDGWITARAGIGNFMFWNPKTKETEEAYGVIADTIVGSIILSEEVGIYNKNNSITLDQNGFTLTTNADGTTPENIFLIQKENKDSEGHTTLDKMLYVDSNGNLTLNGSVQIFGENSSFSTLDGLRVEVDGAVSAAGEAIDTVNSSIKTVDIEYGLSDSDTVEPVTWSTDSPEWVEGKYIWQRTKTVTPAGYISYSQAVCIQGAQGAQGTDGTGIEDIEEQYYLSTSETSQTGGSWGTEQPEWMSGYYIWTRSEITWSDGSITHTTPVLAKAINGANENAIWVRSYMTYDQNGLTVGAYGDPTSVRMSSSGEFQVRENNRVITKISDALTFYDNYGQAAFSVDGDSLRFYNDGSQAFYVDGQNLTFTDINNTGYHANFELSGSGLGFRNNRGQEMLMINGIDNNPTMWFYTNTDSTSRDYVTISGDGIVCRKDNVKLSMGFSEVNIGDDTFRIMGDGWGKLVLGAGTNSLTLEQQGFTLSSMQPGFAVGISMGNNESFVRGVEVYKYYVTDQTNSFNVSLAARGLLYRNVQYVCIYYHCPFSYGRHSLKVAIKQGEKKTTWLTTQSDQTKGIIIVIEKIDITLNGSTLSIERGIAPCQRVSLSAISGIGYNNQVSASDGFYIEQVTVCG